MERELISWLRRRLPPHERLLRGIGDDAAILAMANAEQTVMTVDMLMDGVDFELAEIDPRRVGHKALAVNLSDLAAMAAKPLAAVVAVALPRQGGMALAEALYEGMLPLAERCELALAGGDTNSWDGRLVISVTLLGEVVGKALRRDGAKPGDRILVTGSFGGSILGRHLDFEPRVYEALMLNACYELHAGIDVSDGLSLDLGRLCQESRCGAVVRTASVPVSKCAVRLAEQDGRSPLDHALTDGEDFELILAVPPDEAAKLLRDEQLSVKVTDIGEFVEEPGLWQLDEHGQRQPLSARGWEYDFS